MIDRGSRAGLSHRSGVRVTGQQTVNDGRQEVLRQASVALGGRPVTLWEVSSRAELQPRLSGGAPIPSSTGAQEVRTALRRWNIPILQGSRWVGCPANGYNSWVVAPVRVRPPAPPPGGQERRGPERLTLELAALCVGLIDAHAASTPLPAGVNPLRDLTGLPGIIAHELGNRLTTVRATLQLMMESIAGFSDVSAGRRVELLDDLGDVLEDIDHSTQFLRAVRDRARGALARWERFDAARVVQSCCTLEGRVLKDRVALELEGSFESLYLLGDPNALYDALVNLIRNAADASVGRPGIVRVGMERSGPSLRLIVRDQGHGISALNLERLFESGFTTKGFGEGTGMGLVLVQDVVQNMFGGTINVESVVEVGTTITITLPIPAQRSPT
jgi:signal transduction histidine kinase